MKGKERFNILWSLLIGFRTACCVNSYTCCHLALIGHKCILKFIQTSCVSMANCSFSNCFLSLFSLYRTSCNTCSPKHYLLAQGDALNVKSHN